MNRILKKITPTTAVISGFILAAVFNLFSDNTIGERANNADIVASSNNGTREIRFTDVGVIYYSDTAAPEKNGLYNFLNQTVRLETALPSEGSVCFIDSNIPQKHLNYLVRHATLALRDVDLSTSTNKSLLGANHAFFDLYPRYVKIDPSCLHGPPVNF